MKRFRRGLPILVAAIVLMGLLPGAAGARQGYFNFPPQHYAEFALPASNGYRIHVFDTGHRSIYLIATNDSALVSYEVRGQRAKSGGIKASFPGVGRISVQFEQIGRPHRKPPETNCKGDGSVTRRGVFSGVIVFNGEKGFTKARASRVNGTVFESAKQVCKRQKEGGSESSFHFTLLSASTPRGKGALSFNATKFTSPNSIPDAGLTSFSVSLFQQKGSMSVLHSISQSSEEDSFAVSGPAKRPTMASVTPPAPFSGSASFQRELGSSASWTGTLATELPGIGPVSLAGPEFSASLCVDHFCPDSGGSSRQAVLIVAAAAGRRAAKAAAPSPTPWPR